MKYSVALVLLFACITNALCQTKTVEELHEMRDKLEPGFDNAQQVIPEVTTHSLAHLPEDAGEPRYLITYGDSLAIATRNSRIFFSPTGEVADLREYEYDHGEPDSVLSIDIEGDSVLVVDSDYVTAVNPREIKRFRNLYLISKALLINGHVHAITRPDFLDDYESVMLEFNFDGEIVNRRTWSLEVSSKVLAHNFHMYITKIPPQSYILSSILSGEVIFSHQEKVFHTLDDEHCLARAKFNIELKEYQNTGKRGSMREPAYTKVISKIIVNKKNYFATFYTSGLYYWREFPFTPTSATACYVEYSGNYIGEMCSSKSINIYAYHPEDRIILQFTAPIYATN